MNASFTSWLESRFPFTYQVIDNEGYRFVENRSYSPEGCYAEPQPIFEIYGPTPHHLCKSIMNCFKSQIIDPYETNSWTHMDTWVWDSIRHLIEQVLDNYNAVFYDRPKLLCYLPIQVHAFLSWNYDPIRQQTLADLFHNFPIRLIPLQIDVLFFVRADDLILWMRPLQYQSFFDYLTHTTIKRARMSLCFIQKPYWTPERCLKPWAFKVVNIADIPPIDPVWLHQYQEGKVNPQIGEILL